MMGRDGGSVDRQRAQQLVHRSQRFDSDRVVPFSSADLGTDQTGIAQDTQVLADRRARDRLISREVDHARGATDESPQQLAPDRVSDRSEYIHDRTVTDWLPFCLPCALGDQRWRFSRTRMLITIGVPSNSYSSRRRRWMKRR